VRDGPDLEAMAVETLNALIRIAWLFENSTYVWLYGKALGPDLYFTDPRPVSDSLNDEDMFLFIDHAANSEDETQLLQAVRGDPFLSRAYAEWSDDQLLIPLRELLSWAEGG
jgi:hypothetical protein